MVRRTCGPWGVYALLFVLLLLGGCHSKPFSVTRTSIALGTYVKIIIITDRENRERAMTTIDHVNERVTSWESDFSYRVETGELAQFNSGTTLFRDEHALLFDLLKESLEYARITAGYFDPTVLPLIRVWGFDSETPALPSQQDILGALESVGYTTVHVTANRIDKPEYIQFDLSGIAKGKIVDLTRDFIRDAGFSNFLVDAGGDIYVSGRNLKGSTWRIAIQDPDNRDRYSGILEKSDAAIVTSGDYENFFEHEGKRYSHLFNPFTGYPRSDIRSVTVVTGETALADAVATAVFVMGSDEGFRFLKERGVEGLILYERETGTMESKSTSHFWD
jgi:thiamine biosynthesis lipoprotein